MKTVVGVYLGGEPVRVGELHYAYDHGREASSFAYDPAWLASPTRFEIDPQLNLTAGHQFPGDGQVLFGCFRDTEPDGWGRMVIDRDRAIRKVGAARGALDYLLDVHDESRIGALRFSVDGGTTFLADPGPGKRTAPPLIELQDLVRAANAIEKRTEAARDLRLLLDRGSPPGGMRPKCTVSDEGRLAIGKFPSATDSRDVVRGEVMALQLARIAGVDAANARLVIAAGTPVAVIDRFDRDGAKRLQYISGYTMLGIGRSRESTYLELAHALRAAGGRPIADIEELWRRIVFSVLISNFDDHLNNHGFLNRGGHWTLSPAFDVNPAPGKERVLKTWITEESPAASIELALSALKPMGIDHARGLLVLSEVLAAVDGWKVLAKKLGMNARTVAEYEIAFDHEETAAARKAVAATTTSASRTKRSKP